MTALQDIPGSLTPKQARTQFLLTETFEQYGAFDHHGRVIAIRRVDDVRGVMYYDDSEEARVYVEFVPFDDTQEAL